MPLECGVRRQDGKDRRDKFDYLLERVKRDKCVSIGYVTYRNSIFLNAFEECEGLKLW